MVNALVLAGTPMNQDSLVYGKNKALLDISNNKKVIEYVLDSLYESARVDKIVIVGPNFIGQKKTLDQIIDLYKSHNPKKEIALVHEHTDGDEAERVLSNMAIGLSIVNPGDFLLYATGDIPLARGNHIDDFIAKCLNASPGDFYFCMVEAQKANNKYYTRKRRPAISTMEGEYRPANLALVKPNKIENIDLFARLFAYSRRLSSLASKFRSVRHIGLFDTASLLFKYYTVKVRLKEIEEFASRKLNCNFKLIKSDNPELEYDIDSKDDYNDIKNRIKESSARRAKSSVSLQ